MGISKIVISLFLFSVTTHTFGFSEKEIFRAKEELIMLSIQSFPGNCPCPYSSTRNGEACGRKSHYVKPEGRSPACFVQDISNAEAIHYLKRK